MSVDSMRSPGVLERQSSGVVKDVQKSAQAGIGALASHLPALQSPSLTLLNQNALKPVPAQTCTPHCETPASPGLASALQRSAASNPCLGTSRAHSGPVQVHLPRGLGAAAFA